MTPNPIQPDIPSTPLVIGIGNAIRGDDAAGLQAARELRPLVGRRVRVVESPGGVAELLDLWEGQGQVFLIDALQSGGLPGSWRRLTVGDQPLPASLTATSTHGLSIASAVALGQALGRMPRSLVLYGIEASHFNAGAELSPAVLTGVRQLIRALAEELDAGIPPPTVTGRS